MAFTYDPKEARTCLPNGTYDATLKTAEETVSKKGSPMLKVVWEVQYNNRIIPLWDYIVRPSGIWKLKQIARAWGETGEFDSGSFDLEEKIGRIIGVSVEIENSSQFGEQNKIMEYVECSGQPVERTLPTDHSEDIPF